MKSIKSLLVKGSKHIYYESDHQYKLYRHQLKYANSRHIISEAVKIEAEKVYGEIRFGFITASKSISK